MVQHHTRPRERNIHHFSDQARLAIGEPDVGPTRYLLASGCPHVGRGRRLWSRGRCRLWSQVLPCQFGAHCLACGTPSRLRNGCRRGVSSRNHCSTSFYWMVVGLGRYVGAEDHNLVSHGVQSSYRAGRRLGNSITPSLQYGTACAYIQTAAFDLHTLRGGCRRMASPRAASQLSIWIECSPSCSACQSPAFRFAAWRSGGNRSISHSYLGAGMIGSEKFEHIRPHFCGLQCDKLRAIRRTDRGTRASEASVFKTR